MRLTSDRLARLERSLELALNQEWPQLRATTDTLSKRCPAPTPIGAASEGSRPVIATVATDGGENRLRLEPLQMQIIRVADSRGEIYFEEFIAQSLTAEIEALLSRHGVCSRETENHRDCRK